MDQGLVNISEVYRSHASTEQQECVGTCDLPQHLEVRGIDEWTRLHVKRQWRRLE